MSVRPVESAPLPVCQTHHPRALQAQARAHVPHASPSRTRTAADRARRRTETRAFLTAIEPLPDDCQALLRGRFLSYADVFPTLMLAMYSLCDLVLSGAPHHAS